MTNKMSWLNAKGEMVQALVRCDKRHIVSLSALGDVFRRSTIGFFCGYILFAAAGCERFRHEKYTCPGNSVGLSEILISDDSVGAKMTVTAFGREEQIEIGSVSDDELVAAQDGRIISIDRKNGRIKILSGTKAVFLTCEKSLFTM